jgi:hypothetical protein
MISHILDRVKGCLGFGEIRTTADERDPRRAEERKFIVIANPVVMAFFEEQTKNLSDRVVELVDWYKVVDDKYCALSHLEIMWATSGYNKDGNLNDSYYDVCRAIIKIFLENFPIVDDGFGHKILCTEKEWPVPWGYYLGSGLISRIEKYRQHKWRRRRCVHSGRSGWRCGANLSVY